MKTALALAVVVVLAICSPLMAGPSQEEVFRSINQNVGQTTDPRKFFAALVALAGVMMLLAVLTQRRKRQAVPRAMNHHGKLLKEMARALHLRSSELRQLKMLAEEQSLSSPLTLLLCPSVLAQAVKQKRKGRLDRRAMMQIMRRIAPHG